MSFDLAQSENSVGKCTYQTSFNDTQTTQVTTRVCDIFRPGDFCKPLALSLEGGDNINMVVFVGAVNVCTSTFQL